MFWGPLRLIAGSDQHGGSAVDDELGAAQVAGFVGHQRPCRGRDLLCIARPSVVGTVHHRHKDLRNVSAQLRGRRCRRSLRAQDRRHAGHDRRLQAIDEGVRVLKPVGRLGIADFWSGTYARHLRERGLETVQQLALGWRFWLRTWAWGRPGHGDQTVRRSRLISSGTPGSPRAGHANPPSICRVQSRGVSPNTWRKIHVTDDVENCQCADQHRSHPSAYGCPRTSRGWLLGSRCPAQTTPIRRAATGAGRLRFSGADQ